MTDRNNELLQDLFSAVAAKDAKGAFDALMLVRTASHSEAHRELAAQALRTVANLPTPVNVAPIPLPQPGADAHAVFGGQSSFREPSGRRRARG